MTDIRRTQLTNGLKVISIEQPNLALCYVYLTVAVGSIFENDEEHGLSHFIEHCIFSGAGHFEDEISVWNAVETVGGSINAFTSKDTINVFCKILSSKLEHGISIIADMVTNPSFNEKDVKKEKGILASEISKSTSGIVHESYRFLLENLFTDHPVRNEIIGTNESVSKFNSNLMRMFMDKHFAPANMALAVVGPIGHEAVVKLAEKYINSQREPTRVALPQYKRLESIGEKEKRVTGDQSAVVVGFRTPNVIDKESSYSDIVSYSIGQMATFGLRNLIRFSGGLAYTVKSGWNGYISGSYSALLIRCLPDRSDAIVQTTKEFIDVLSNEKPNEKTLDRIRNSYTGNFLVTKDNPDLLCRKLAYCEVYGVEHLLELDKAALSISPDKYLETCRNHFSNYELIKILPKT